MVCEMSPSRTAGKALRVAPSPYTGRDLVRVASRLRNAKRGYLLVDPLQGKHMPADPAVALGLGRYLGAAVRAAFPGARTVIGFSETATAIGRCVAGELAEGAFFVQTTREPDVEGSRWILFEEEHSHASEQRLCADELEKAIRDPGEIVLVDDELSTGRTVLNLARALLGEFPALVDRKLVAASLINRLDEDQVAALDEVGISCVCLVHRSQQDYSAVAEMYDTTDPESAERPAAPTDAPDRTVDAALPFQDPRVGHVCVGMRREVKALATHVKAALGRRKQRLLVLGTEEFMHVPMLLAQELQARWCAERVQFHATTRSPIGVCADPNYPIWNGYSMPSMYGDRVSYIYDMEPADAAVVCTDSRSIPEGALRAVCRVLRAYGCRKIVLARIRYEPGARE